MEMAQGTKLKMDLSSARKSRVNIWDSFARAMERGPKKLLERGHLHAKS